MKVRENQAQRILNYMIRGFSLTPLQALRLVGTMKLASRISEIRYKYRYKQQYKGFRLVKEMVSSGKKRFAKYSLRKRK